VTEFSGLQVC